MARILTAAFISHSEDMPATQFAKSLTALLRVIDAVDYSIHQGKQRDNWLIEKLESSSPTVRMYSKRNAVDAVSVIGNGLRLINADESEPPPHFTEMALKGIHGMRTMLGDRAPLEAISIAIDSEHITEVKAHTVENAGRILRAGYSNLSSIRGRLEAMNVHRIPVATVWDRVSGAPVKFQFVRGEIDNVKALVNRHVLVTGTVTYFGNGTPRAIHDVIEIADVSRKEYIEHAGFASVPDSSVRETGAANMINSQWTSRDK